MLDLAIYNNVRKLDYYSSNGIKTHLFETSFNDCCMHMKKIIEFVKKKMKVSFV